MTRFIGVSDMPGEAMTTGVGPYEFSTDQGVPIYLHDTDYLGLEQPSASGLRLYFSFHPRWTPEAARETPVVELDFTDVQYRPHPLRHRAGRDADEPARFVYGFDWDGMNAFALDTSEIKLAFTASHLTVRLLSSAPAGLHPPGSGEAGGTAG